MSPIFDSTGTAVRADTITRDISERKRADEALCFQAQSLNMVGRAVIATNMENKVMYWKHFSETLYGWSAEEAIGSSITDLTLADTSREQAAALITRLYAGESWSGEFTVRGKDGRTFPMLATDTPIVDEYGALRGVIGVSMDITERKRAELALRQYNQRLSILHRIDRGILTAQPPQRIAEMIVHSLTEIIPGDAVRIITLDSDNAMLPYLAAYPPTSQDSQALLKQAIENYGLPDNFRRGEALLIDDTKSHNGLWMGFEAVLTAQGARSWIIVPLIVGEQLVGALAVGSLRPLAFTSEYVDIAREIADQLAIALHKAHLDEQIEEHSRMLEARITQRTEQLQSAKERIEAVLNSTSDAILLAQMDGTIEQVNPAFTALFGVGLEAGRTVSLFSLLDSASADRLRHTLAEISTSGQARRMELVGIHQEGRLFHADVALAPVINSLPTIVIGSVRDISLYKQAEESLLTALAREKEVNELKTSFTSIVSHEFRTPLSVILSSTELLSQYFDRMDQNRRQEKLENIERQVKRLIKLLDDVLTITRSESTGFEFKSTSFDLVALCEELIEEVSVGQHPQVTFDISYQGNCRQVNGDQFLFSHILQNLATNAVKYSNASGRVRISLTYSEVALTLRVEDRGIGIPLEHQSRLFEAFRRADNVGQIQGTGIGLTIVRRAVDAYGGTIEFESVEGQGTTFTVMLPTTDQKDEGNLNEN